MTLKEITEQKLENYNKVPERFLTSLQKAEIVFYKELLLLVDELERQDGVILLNSANIAKIVEIENKLKPLLLDTTYVNTVKEFINSVDEQAKLTTAYFKAVFKDETFTTTEADLVLKNRKRNAADSLLGDGVDASFIDEVKKQINYAVETKSTYRELLDNLQTVVTGDKETDSKLFQYAKQVTNDTFAISDRAYTNSISIQLKAEWFLYSGNQRAATREFCLSRFGKYFHKNEIEEWAKLEWGGKIEGTNESTIFITAGGWGCRHSILPVSKFVVPKDVIQRNIDNGNYLP